MTNNKYPTAVLALADGKIFTGSAFGYLATAENPVIGEVVFNTSMYGYQEIMTDPSYAKQIMTFTYPHIGNVGCNAEDEESDTVFVEGIICRDITKVTSNFRSTETLDAYLSRNKKMGLFGIDTRELALYTRTNGSQMGAMAVGENIDSAALVAKAKQMGSMEGMDLVPVVATKKVYKWNKLPWDIGKGILEDSNNSKPHCVAVDCGIKRNILSLLVEAGFKVTVVPPTTSASEIQNLKPDGVFLSNGPGDPATLGYIIDTVKALLGKTPIFGICLGHQILSQAVGGSTYKLKFGHRGGNHPVLDLRTKEIEITVQNHGFAVKGDSHALKGMVSHINLNDNTVEGLEIKDKKAFSVQYHPEASPGPHDAIKYFKQFFNLVTSN